MLWNISHVKKMEPESFELISRGSVIDNEIDGVNNFGSADHPNQNQWR